MVLPLNDGCWFFLRAAGPARPWPRPRASCVMRSSALRAVPVSAPSGPLRRRPCRDVRGGLARRQFGQRRHRARLMTSLRWWRPRCCRRPVRSEAASSPRFSHELGRRRTPGCSGRRTAAPGVTIAHLAAGEDIPGSGSRMRNSGPASGDARVEVEHAVQEIAEQVAKRSYQPFHRLAAAIAMRPEQRLAAILARATAPRPRRRRARWRRLFRTSADSCSAVRWRGAARGSFCRHGLAAITAG